MPSSSSSGSSFGAPGAYTEAGPPERIRPFGRRLRTSMATCGYKDIAEFNRAELMIAPALQTEGKALQTAQGVGMGARGSSRAAPTGNGSSVDRTPAGVSAN